MRKVTGVVSQGFKTVLFGPVMGGVDNPMVSDFGSWQVISLPFLLP